MATVRLLRELERHTGQRIQDMFDLIGGHQHGCALAQTCWKAWSGVQHPHSILLTPSAVGTSTGGLLAVAIGLRQMTPDECSYIYKVLGQKVFSRVVSAKEGKEESWTDVSAILVAACGLSWSMWACMACSKCWLVSCPCHHVLLARPTVHLKPVCCFFARVCRQSTAASIPGRCMSEPWLWATSMMQRCMVGAQGPHN
jgi:hypothetical protein